MTPLLYAAGAAVLALVAYAVGRAIGQRLMRASDSPTLRVVNVLETIPREEQESVAVIERIQAGVKDGANLNQIFATLCFCLHLPPEELERIQANYVALSAAVSARPALRPAFAALPLRQLGRPDFDPQRALGGAP